MKQEPVLISGIWVRNTRPDGPIEVLVERDGEWFLIHDKKMNFSITSHIIEPNGILNAPKDYI